MNDAQKAHGITTMAITICLLAAVTLLSLFPLGIAVLIHSIDIKVEITPEDRSRFAVTVFVAVVGAAVLLMLSELWQWIESIFSATDGVTISLPSDADA